MINRANLLTSLRELADREFQEAVWLGRDPGSVSSFTEVVCGAFDDTGLSDALEAGEAEKELGRAISLLIGKLEEALKGVNKELSVEQLVASWPMSEVRSLSGQLITLLEAEDA